MIIFDKLTKTDKIKHIICDIDGTITRWINVELFLIKSCEQIGLPYKGEYLNLLFEAIRRNELHSIVTGSFNETEYAKFLSRFKTKWLNRRRIKK